MSTKVHLVKAMVFPVAIYGCESWTIKKAECWRIDAFELWCWRGLLRFPWTARRSNQSILKEISPERSLEGLNVEAETPILWPPNAEAWIRGLSKVGTWTWTYLVWPAHPPIPSATSGRSGKHSSWRGRGLYLRWECLWPWKDPWFPIVLSGCECRGSGLSCRLLDFSEAEG